MENNRLTLGKASFCFVVTLILGVLIPIPVIGVFFTLLHQSTKFDTSLFFAPLLVLLYTIPIWLGMSLLGFLTDLIIVSSEISLRNFVLTEWLISIIISIWPIINNFSLEVPSRCFIYLYFIPLSLLSFYLKGKYLVRKGVISNFVV